MIDKEKIEMYDVFELTGISQELSSESTLYQAVPMGWDSQGRTMYSLMRADANNIARWNNPQTSEDIVMYMNADHRNNFKFIGNKNIRYTVKPAIEILSLDKAVENFLSLVRDSDIVANSDESLKAIRELRKALEEHKK